MSRFRWSKWSWLWLIWIGLFLAIEIPAIFNDTPDDTLSEHLWQVTSVSFFWFLVAGFVVWFAAHILGPKVRRWFKTWRK